MTHLTYPDESFTYCYAFQPIHAEELCRDGHLACWTDDSGMEPFAVIEIPDGSQITQTEDGWQLLIPDRPHGIDAEDVYELATHRPWACRSSRSLNPAVGDTSGDPTDSRRGRRDGNALTEHGCRMHRLNTADAARLLL